VKINLDNQFGELKITTWNKNEVKGLCTITSKANTDERAQEFLDRISIEDSKSRLRSILKTKLTDQKKDWEKRDRKEYRDESSVSIRCVDAFTESLDAVNRIWPMIVPDLSGPVEFGK